MIAFLKELLCQRKFKANLKRMSTEDLLKQINYDAEDWKFNTEYSAEYDRRRAQTLYEKALNGGCNV